MRSRFDRNCCFWRKIGPAEEQFVLELGLECCQLAEIDWLAPDSNRTDVEAVGGSMQAIAGNVQKEVDLQEKEVVLEEGNRRLGWH